MPRDPIPLTAPDISVFARSLSRQLAAQPSAPSHLGLMNVLARAAGFRNYQHLKADHAARDRIAEAPLAEVVDHVAVARAMQHFDRNGLLLRWPARRPVQELCLWAMWAALPSAHHMHEREVSARLDAAHGFADAAILRRSLVGMALLRRDAAGTDYLRIEQRPPPEARDLIRRVTERRVAADAPARQAKGSAG